MAYLVIERFDADYPPICTDMESGMPLIFETKDEAQEEADECQDGLVVEF